MSDILAKLTNAAKLCKIELTQEELLVLAPKANKIFSSFERISELQTQDVDPLYTFREGIELREDEAADLISTHDLFSIAPESASDHYVVPRVVGGE